MQGGSGMRRIAAVIGLSVFGLTACAPTTATRGNLPDPELVADIRPGATSLGEVRANLGTPSTTATFGTPVWYYMSERTETLAFFRPKVIERQIIAVVFDDTEQVKDIVTYTEEDGKPIELVSRVTPTAGNEFTFLQQLFGNFGRFNDVNQ